MIRTFRSYLRCDVVTNFRSVDKKMANVAGTHFLRLNGCIGCDKHVYLPDDRTKFCPRRLETGAVCDHPRYDPKGKPYEV